MTRLVLHFDVNKTVLVDDAIQRIDAATSCAQILYWASWGRVTRGRWVWNGEEPSLWSDDRQAVRYGDHVLATPKLRRRRYALKRDFLEPGQPGRPLRPWFDRMMEALTLSEATQEALRDQPWAAAAGLDRGRVRLLPSFFKLMKHLHDARRDFTLVFRTYGSDIPEVAAELNAFCEGRHPEHPEVRLDGRAGGPDRRLDLGDPARFGVLHRGGHALDDAQAITVGLGTLERPADCDRAPFQNDLGETLARSWRALDGAAALRRHILDQGGTLAFRDDYAWWARHRFSARAGKPLRVDRGDAEHLEVFFDDNIFEDDARIVDVRDLHTGDPLRLRDALGRHLVRVSPFNAILDEDYFIAQLQRCEAAAS